MNNLTKTLLGGAALSALAAAPALAHHAPQFHIQALHAGKRVNKTKIHNQRALHITYTLGIYTAIPAAVHKAVPLVLTFYKWNTYSDAALCTEPKQKIKAQRKSLYGKVRTATETYSFGNDCSYVFYGDTYTLIDPSGAGQTDSFVSTLYGRFKTWNGAYRGKLILDVSVAIGAKLSVENSN